MLQERVAPAAHLDARLSSVSPMPAWRPALLFPEACEAFWNAGFSRPGCHAGGEAGRPNPALQRNCAVEENSRASDA
jgi:hypothetical protein